MNRALNYLVILIYVIACNSVKKPDSENLKRVWMLVSYKDFDKAYLTQKGAFLDLTQQENAVSKMGCNNLSFPYKIVSNSEIQFNDGIATKMYCEDMKLEDEFVKSITQIETFQIDGHQLILNSILGEKIIFVAQDWD